jgi:pyridoxine 5-phosphate synthase
MTKTALSVNLNKVALVRNSRTTTIPDPLRAAATCIAAGCQGITVHPRPDQRHIRPDDVERLTEMLAGHPDIEFNIEGNPFAGPEPNGFPGFMELVERARPHQTTLVPDSPDQLTSDHGWDVEANVDRLRPIIEKLHSWGSRVSIFVDPSPRGLELARSIGVDRVELYTGPYAEAHAHGNLDEVLPGYVEAGRVARECGLGLNAGHDLNLTNLADLLRAVDGIDEVSIGHALIVDALFMGLGDVVGQYIETIAGAYSK